MPEMAHVVAYTIISVVIVSLVSLVGILSLLWKRKNVKDYLLLLVSLSAGTLFGGAFLHLLPEAVEESGFTITISLLLLAGVVVFFVLEKFIHWRHCHHHLHDHSTHTEHHARQSIQEHLSHMPKKKSIAILNLTGDAVHNFLDGLIIAGSYFVNVHVGIATTIAVILHEVPQEIADFGVLLYSGLSKAKALLLNFGTAVVAIIGAIVGLILGARSEAFVVFILPFAAGGFLYIAGSNLIPELHKECGLKDSLWHLVAMLLGIGIMVALLFLEHTH